MATGVNLIKNAVRVCMGMPPENIRSCNYDGFWAILMLHSDKDKNYDEVQFDKSVESHIVSVDIVVNKGDYIRAFRGANDSIGTVIVRCERAEQIDYIINNVAKLVSIKGS